MIRKFLNAVIETTLQVQPNSFVYPNPFTKRETAHLGWLMNVAPCFPIKADKISILSEPQQFYGALIEYSRSARRRITLASLYLGNGDMERRLVDAILGNENFSKLQVNVLLDFSRGSRLKNNSRKMLQPLLEKGESNCRVSLYHTPVLRGLYKKLAPNRWNEIFGIQHMKLYIFDDTLLISGANLSSDYFTNRQDRYFVIEDKHLCDFYTGLVNRVEQFSFTVDKYDQVKMNSSWDQLPYEGSQYEFEQKAGDLVERYMYDCRDEQNCGNITRLKETNDALASREAALKAQLRNKEALLQAAVATSEMFERQVKKDLQTLERTFCTTLGAFERTVGDRLLRLARRHSKLTGDVATLKAENELKCESSARLAASLHALRLENERNVRTVDELRAELGRSTALRCDAEASDGRTRQALARKEREVDELKAKVDELKKDMQDATMIIAQKTKTHDELAKDLVQANSMLVNFNNQYDALSKELDDARETNAQKDRQLREQSARLAKTVDEFERYRCQFNNEETARLRQELHVAKQALLELEKQNREAIKLNGLLTRKISMGDTAANVRSSPNLVPPSQRNNY